MVRYIPEGRDDLWRRQKVADAEVQSLEQAFKDADRRATDLARELHPDDRVAQDAAEAAERAYAAFCRAEAVAERIYAERTAGLSAWIDTCTHLPVCSACGGTGGPRLAGGGVEDARTSCSTCRGWGREDDGRPTPPVWSDKARTWINPATGWTVDLPDPTEESSPAPPPAPPSARSTATPPGGATMSDIENAAAGTAGAIAHAQQAAGAAHQAHSDLTAGLGMLVQALQGRTLGEPAIALFAKAQSDAEALGHTISGASAEAEAALGRLG